MSPRVSPLAVVVVAVALLGGLAAFWRVPAEEVRTPDSRPVVATSVYPLYDIVRNVAGSAVDVVLILPPGSSPHAYEPRPSDVRKLDTAAVAYVIGHGLDGWMSTLTEASKTPLRSVDAGIMIRALPDEEEGAEHEEEAGHNHDEGDPHYWLAVANAKLMAQNIADDLSARYPASAAIFASNLSAYQVQLDETDQRMRDILTGVTNRKLVTMHDAWYYFADAYGLEIVGSFEPSPGREPTPQYLVELKAAVVAAQAKTLYTEPLIATANIQSFIADNGLTVATLDPVEGAAGEEHRYVDIMLDNARTIRDNQ